MRARLSALLVVAASSLVAAQTPQNPVFRSGIELLEVDVNVVDERGRPVQDLRAPEFVVTVDGDPRQVVTADFIRDGVPVEVKAQPDDPYISTNADKPRGRLIVIAIDRNNFGFSRSRDITGAADRFLDRLTPADRVALWTVPSGPAVNFTSDHQQIREALLLITSGDDLDRGRFEMSPYEALAIDNGSDQLAIERALLRLCGDRPDARCYLDIQQEAMAVSQQIRRKAAESVTSLMTLLTNLKDVEGTKSLILLSQGLNLDGTRAEAAMLGDLAAEARVNVNVMMFDEALGDAQLVASAPMTQADRDLKQQGLEMFASSARGALFRVTANPDATFNRLSTELSAHYMLGVEPGQKDRDGKNHQIRVEVRRKGVTVRARREVQYAVPTPDPSSRDKAMMTLLRSPFSSTELPLRLTTYIYRDPDSPNVKLVVASEVDPVIAGQADLAFGYALLSREGRAVSVGGERKIFTATGAEPFKYDMAVTVEPGTYNLKFGVIDGAGNRGSVEREVHAWQMSGEALAVGDLVLSPGFEGRQNVIRPVVNLRVDTGRLAAYMELYSDRPEVLDQAAVVLEIAEGEDSPALLSDRASVRPRTDGPGRQVQALMLIGNLPPGRYLARALISSSGQTVGKLVRPFFVVPAPRKEPTPSGALTSVVGTSVAPVRSSLVVTTSPAQFQRDEVLKADVLRAVFDLVDKARPGAKAAVARARTGQFEGTALMALESGDQATGAFLRGLELFAKGQIDPAATQFDVSLKAAPEFAPAAFYLGACYAAAGKDGEAAALWQRVRASQPDFPLASRLMGYARLRLGRPDQALELLNDAFARQPQDDDLRKNLAIVQAVAGQDAEAYATLAPYLQTHPTDPDALLMAIQTTYLAHASGKSINTPEEDVTQAAKYAKAYAAANGAYGALVVKWMDFLTQEKH